MQDLEPAWLAGFSALGAAAYKIAEVVYRALAQKHKQSLDHRRLDIATIEARAAIHEADLSTPKALADALAKVVSMGEAHALASRDLRTRLDRTESRMRRLESLVRHMRDQLEELGAPASVMSDIAKRFRDLGSID